MLLMLLKKLGRGGCIVGEENRVLQKPKPMAAASIKMNPA